MTKPQAMLFDLDGTLVDTAPDMGDALNVLLNEYGYESLPKQTIRPHVSHGARGLIDIGFGEPPEGAMFEKYRERFLEIYESRLCQDTKIFDGMLEVLEHLENNHYLWGIVTNKPDYLTQPLLKALDLHSRASCIVSGDTIQERKPHPAPLLHACKSIDRSPTDCIYVGDAERDIQAGRNAGMQTLVALFGYIGDDDTPELWGANGQINHPQDIIPWLDNYV